MVSVFGWPKINSMIIDLQYVFKVIMPKFFDVRDEENQYKILYTNKSISHETLQSGFLSFKV